MNKRFSINEIYISKLEQAGKGFYPKLETAPLRWCVIDSKEKVAIDIEKELKYDYLQTNLEARSDYYLMKKASELISEDKRAAICPLEPISVKSDILIKGNRLIDDIVESRHFPYASELYTDEQWLELINDEKQENKINDNKVKIMKKKRK